MVWIEQIAVEGLGPLGERSLELGRLNLIYGGNETGKTYLVEFILRSLFRHADLWPMRDELGRGMVTVRGLGDEPVSFTPGGQQKLEDFWQQDGLGLPTNMARLMVVKGAELALTDTDPVGLDRAVLKAALSSEPLIDRILENIQLTVQAAEVVEGRIEGAQRGEIKDRQTQLEQLQRLGELAEQVDRRYSAGRIRTLELDLERVQSELAQQQQAKRHLAFTLRKERETLQAKRNELPRERLEELVRDIARHQDKQTELERLRVKREEARSEVTHYPWLKQAIDLWEARSLDRAGPGGPLLPLASGGLLVLGTILALVGVALDLAPAGRAIVGAIVLVFISGGVGMGVMLLSRARRQLESAIDIDQRREIEAEFERRFGRPPSGLVGLKHEEEALRDGQASFKNLSASIDESEADLDKLTANVDRLLRQLGAGKVTPDSWSQIVDNMRQWDTSLADQIHDIDLRLGKLGVDESDYRAEPGEIEFSAERLEALQQRKRELEQELLAAQRDLENLKQEVTRETGDEISAPWGTVLEHLAERRRQVEAEYRHATARILGQIGVTQVLDRVRAEEDRKIREALRAPEIGDLLHTVTGQYRSLDMTDGDLTVQADVASYPLADLSTGAREQVLLALRMGFASRLAGGQPLFLILDDAFQHSDWERRERLVDQAVKLVEAGWQVTYLTMDDHLSDLFHTAGRQALGKDYRQHALEV